MHSNRKKLLLLFIVFLFGNLWYGVSTSNNIKFRTFVPNWVYLVDALIQVESSNNDLAIGAGNDIGCLQITPIYVTQCNEILGKKVFTLADRFERNKSIQMFAVYQRYFNPLFNIEKAIKLHNPNAKHSYLDSVIANLNRAKSLNKVNYNFTMK